MQVVAQRMMGNIIGEAKSKLGSIKAKINEKNKEKDEIIIDCKFLREEMKTLKNNVKGLRKYNIDWILEWSKTPNFAFWVNSHAKNVANRSLNASSTDNNLIVYENGDIYYGSLVNGLREGNQFIIDMKRKIYFVFPIIKET